MPEIERPENFMANSKKASQTVNFLDHMMFNLEQLKVENYHKREPKYLFKLVKKQAR